MKSDDEGIIFDLDGTLFQTEKVAVPAFHRTFRRLRDRGLYQGTIPSDERIQSVFGMTQADIWERLLPGAAEEVKREADAMWLRDELDCLQEGMGGLYPGVTKGLRELKERGWRLFVASNGLGPYVRGVLDTFGLTFLMEGIYSAGEKNIRQKERLVALLKEEQGVSSGYMVGDRSSDVRAGKANGLVVIGCRYAHFPQFSNEDELEGADAVIRSFDQLLPLLKNPCRNESSLDL
ncbi:phosphoglycolate phosphatase-like HAD superfamily hydrolase [Melghirimyces profundicolus]|uniref:Phosphoglycolate phosphatase-like HAD superfamily hydrolase n=1 Tax=Melghirimyces profundicolus TaxID=1242148 RepID=A0A2T6BPY2_9BACL|nr:HAD hydrolase-like protein [Melghirimyces profundicolus]PTX58138.1 phosphoglycolate phosphatase-like HAD superfamily hydrolase [Melghirimyces profundicolus]